MAHYYTISARAVTKGELAAVRDLADGKADQVVSDRGGALLGLDVHAALAPESRYLPRRLSL